MCISERSLHDKRVSFLSAFTLCLSRACLTSRIKWRKRTRFLTCRAVNPVDPT